MEKKYLYLVVVAIWFGNTSAQDLPSCDKANEVGILLDTAQDFISRAKELIPMHLLGTYIYHLEHYSVEEKPSEHLETATNLISAAKQACTAAGNKLPKYRVVCYFSSWSNYRKGRGKFEISDIDPSLCTHIIYAFAKLDDNQIQERDPKIDLGGIGNMDGYKKFNDLKLKNPKLKTIVSVGGWSAGPAPYSVMAHDPDNRARFVESVVPFLQKYGFDGLEIAWQYPGSNGGRPGDREDFVMLLQELNASLKAHGLLLTATVSKTKSEIDYGYDIPAIAKELDFIHLKSYNFHGYEKNATGMSTPLFTSEEAGDSEHSVDFVVDYLLKNGAPREKLVLGLSMRAKSFTLADPDRHGISAAIKGPGNEGPFTRDSGSLGFNEFCVNLTKHSWNSVYDSNARAPYAYKGNQWISYDDQNSFNSKIDYVIEKGLAGVSLWAIDTDDFRGDCYGKKWYMLDTVAGRLLR